MHLTSTLLTTFSLLSLAAAAPAPTAQDGHDPWGQVRVKLWKHTNFRGELVFDDYADSDWCFHVKDGAEQTASSILVRGGCCRFYSDRWCSSVHYFLKACDEEIANLHDLGYGDRISSMKCIL